MKYSTQSNPKPNVFGQANTRQLSLGAQTFFLAIVPSPRTACLALFLAGFALATGARAANTANSNVAASAILTPGKWSLGHVPTVTEDAVITTAAGIRPMTAGNLTVGSFNDTVSGTSTIRNETTGATDSILTLGGAGDLGNSVSGTAGDLLYVASGATLSLTGPNGGSGSGVLNLALGQSGSFNAAGTMTISAGISGSTFGITKAGAGTLTLSGNNTFTGATTLSAGVLKLGAAGALGNGTLNTSGLTLSSGTFDFAGFTPTAIVPLNLNSTTSTADVGSMENSIGSATYGGTVSLGASTVVFGTTASGLLFNNTVTGNSKGLKKDGTGTLELSNGGTVTLAALAANRGTIQVDSGTTLNVTTITVGSGNSVGSGLTLNGGSVTATGAALFGTASSGTGSGTLQINSGSTLTVPSLNKGGSAGASVVFNANFNGGTLKANGGSATFFSGANNAKVQVGGVILDDGGNVITISQALIADTVSTGGGLTKQGSGTLTLSGANTYGGSTTVSAGKLFVSSAQTTTGGITVSDAATLRVTVSGTSQLQPSTLTLGASTGATLEFNGITSTTVAPLKAATMAASGTQTIVINSGTFVAGNSYPLITWTSGSAPTVNLSSMLAMGVAAHLVATSTSLSLAVDSVSDVWTGGSSGLWDNSATGNWTGHATIFADGDAVLFDDTATGTTSVTVNQVVQPAGVVLNNSAKTYTITSSAGKFIGGSTSLTKNGSGSLTLAGGFNTNSGATTISGGTISVGTLTNGGAASDIGSSANAAANLILNGGAFQYTGGAASSDRLFTIGTTGATLDASGTGALNLTNSGAAGLSGSGARTFTLTGTSTAANTLTPAIGDIGGSTSLSKSGVGKWTLAGANTFSGGLIVNAGTVTLLNDQSGATGGFLQGTNNAGTTLNIGSSSQTAVTKASVAADKTVQIATSFTQFNSMNVAGANSFPTYVTNNGTLLVARESTMSISGYGNWIQNSDLTVSGNGGFPGALNVNANGAFVYGGVNLITNTANGGSGVVNLTINGSFTTGQGFYFNDNGSSGFPQLTVAAGGTLALSANISQLITTGGSGPVGKFLLGNGGGVIDTAGFGTTLGLSLTDVTSQTGSLTKAGAGTLTLSAANTYSGNTTISAGTLALSGSGSIANSANIIVGAGVTFDVSGLSSAFTLSSGQTLSNSAVNAVINGTNNTASGTLSLIYDGANPSFIITNGGMTLSASTVFKVNNTGTTLLPGSYKIIAKATSGNVGLVAGSVPTVTLTGGQPSAGTPTLSIVNGELYLTVGGNSVWSYTGTSFTYDGTGKTPAIGFAGSGGAESTNYVGVSLSYGPSASAPTNAGTYSVTNTVVADANYFGTTNSQQFAINPKAASVTADAKTKTYGDVNPALTAVTNGAVNGDMINVSIATDATQFSAVGVSNITVTLGSNPNYTVLMTNSTLTINPANTFIGASSTLNPSGFKDAVSFLATLPVDATGNVVFASTNAPISTNSLTAGSATSLSITNLPRGTNLITVAYLGDGNYVGSTNTLNQIVTNHPPVAVDASYSRAKGLSLKIAITNLLTYVTDVDGDTATLSSVGTGLTNATIMTDDNYVYYLPTTDAGSNDNDSVSYTVSDGFGGPATANILINVYSAAGPAQMSLPTNGVVNIKFFGIPNYTYLVQTTTNLSVPWWTLSTNTAGTNGSWMFTDPDATNAQQYYRSAQP